MLTLRIASSSFEADQVEILFEIPALGNGGREGGPIPSTYCGFGFLVDRTFVMTASSACVGGIDECVV